MPTGTAPCKTACPAHIPVQGYLKLAAQGRYTDALELIKKENPFPAVCGRICNKRCEAECTRGDVDEAVAIDEVKRFIADHDLHGPHATCRSCSTRSAARTRRRSPSSAPALRA